MMYTLKLTEQEINLILGALSELPIRVAMPLVASIQINVQLQKEHKDASNGNE